MREKLFPFQSNAVSDLHEKIDNSHKLLTKNNPQIISFSSPTGSGKTIVMTSLFEDIFYGSSENIADPEATIVWLSDSPELNEQTRLKIESKSDKIKVKNLVTIESTFDEEYLEGGHIYFLNTQKLGSEKLLINKSDRRDFSIWETLSNTANRAPDKFYIVIDEAHRGTHKSTQAKNETQTIMRKFIEGSSSDNLIQMPLVIGVTATPQRFNKLISTTNSTLHKVLVSPDEVRESGLLKDRIIINYPEKEQSAYMTMLKGAAREFQRKSEEWRTYCKNEAINQVDPIFIIQVEDGNRDNLTETDLSSCIEIIEETLGNKLHENEVVHTFNDYPSIDINGLEIKQVEASRINEDHDIKIVFFKMNLSTGWDCPRAETMMSFRRAADYTYIAQLLGRMIRTPLARRVTSNDMLNNVSLFLPYFNNKTVQNVVNSLKDNDSVVPVDTTTSRQLVNFKRNPSYANVFSSMDELVTYKVNSARKQSPLKLLMQLARAITMDGIEIACLNNVRDSILDKMNKEVEKIKEKSNFDERVEDITGVNLSKMTYSYGEEELIFNEDTHSLTVSNYDIAKNFEYSGKLLGEGLHKEYWIRYNSKNHIDVKLEIIILTSDINAMQNLDEYAQEYFMKLYKEYQRNISKLNESRKDIYNRLTETSPRALPIPWQLPETIDFPVSDAEDKLYKNHLYAFSDGTFQTSLNPWEDGVLSEELENGAVCWLRNLDRKNWSLEIPYENDGVNIPMYPDLLIVREDKLGYIFDILEPHDPSRKDNYPKAVGLAKFSESNWDKFGRIELIRKEKGADGKQHFFRLDMTDTIIRNNVRGITSNEELDRIFKRYSSSSLDK